MKYSVDSNNDIRKDFREVANLLFLFAFLFIFLVLFVLILLNLRPKLNSEVNEVNSWGPTAEFDSFSNLESGQDRWSLHKVDMDVGDSKSSYYVLVDHSTGIQYLYTVTDYSTSVCPLLNSDGTPQKISEAG